MIYDTPEWSEEDHAHVERFETRLENGEHPFMDSAVFEYLIGYYLEHSDLVKALITSELAVEQHPFNAQLKLEKAHVLAQLQRYKEALEVLDAVDVLQAGDPDALLLRGEIYFESGEYQESCWVLEHLMDTYAVNREDAVYPLGMCYLQLKEYQKAKELLSKSVLRHQDREEILDAFTYACAKTGELEELVLVCKALLDENPFLTYAWIKLGMAYEDLDAYTDAADAYEYALAIESCDFEIYYRLGICYFEVGLDEKALKAFETALDKDATQSKVCLGLGKIHERNKRISKAMRYYHKAALLDDQSDEAFLGIAECLYSQEKWFESIHFYKKSLRLSEDSGYAWLGLAKAEFHVDNLYSSFEAFEKASQFLPEKIEVWSTWAKLLFEDGQKEEALNVLSEAIQNLSEEPSLQYQMVAYLILSGRIKEGGRMLEDTLKMYYDEHTQLYKYFPTLESQKVIFRLVQQLHP